MYNDELMFFNVYSRIGLCRCVVRDDGFLGIVFRCFGGIVGVSYDCVWFVKEIFGVLIMK